MFGSYLGPRTGPSSQDIQMLQALYGTRTPDNFQGAAGNGTFATATRLPSTDHLTLTGDITTSRTVEYFKVTTPANTDTFVIRVKTSGISLLTPTLAVYDSSQNLLQATAASDPLHGNLVIRLNQATPNTTYYVRVGGALRNVFGVGSYQLRLDYQDDYDPADAPRLIQPDYHANNTLATATALTFQPAVSRRDGVTASYFSTIADSADSHYYRVVAPDNAGAANQELVVAVRPLNVHHSSPGIHVFDPSGNAVPFMVLSNDTSGYTIQVANPVANAPYYIQADPVSAQGKSITGDYFLRVSFDTQATISTATVGHNTLTRARPQDSASLTVHTSALMHFALYAGTATGTGGEVVTMTIQDASGKVVSTLTVQADYPAVTADLYLAAGNYRVSYFARGLRGSLSVPLSYRLDASVLSDPLGPYFTDSNGTNAPPPDYSYLANSIDNSTSYVSAYFF
jgi:hypothetical protein